VSFLWPTMLALLLLIPLGAWLYLLVGARRRGRLAGFGGLAVEPSAAAPARRTRLRRRVTAAFFVVGSTVMVIALARPQAVLSLPRLEGTVILAFDVSGSMAADDLKPTRMEAAKAAARAFIERQPASVQIGVVAFSDGGLSVQAPSNQQADVLAAISRLTPTRGTSVGQGILASLKVIAAQEAGSNPDYYTNRSPSASPSPSPTPVPAGTHTSAVIVLLTDGENNAGTITPQTAADAAAALGIKVYTVGAGTRGLAPYPTQDFFGNKVYRPMQVDVDEPMLKKIAMTTNGRYFRATDTASLRDVYSEIDRSEKTAFEAPEFLDYRELYPWLAWPALALVLVEVGLAETVLRKLP